MGKNALKQLFAVIVLMIPTAQPLVAQADGGMLFSYEPHPGQKATFDEGYRRHLDWHIEKRDSLPWYAWDIIAGRRLGEFVDGTFGVRFDALDKRVDPAGDAADAAQNVTPFARATGRWAVRVRRELSTHTPLESREVPARLAQVVTYHVPLGLKTAFEDVLRQARRRATANKLLPWTIYETVAGGRDAEFMLMVWHAGFALFDEPARDPVLAIGSLLSGSLASAVRSESELWQYREDLTHVPR